MRVRWVGKDKKNKASCGCLSGAAPSPTVLKTVKKAERHENVTESGDVGILAFPPCLQLPVEELTCPRGNPAEKRFLLGQLPWFFGDMTPQVASSVL